MFIVVELKASEDFFNELMYRDLARHVPLVPLEIYKPYFAATLIKTVRTKRPPFKPVPYLIVSKHKIPNKMWARPINLLNLQSNIYLSFFKDWGWVVWIRTSLKLADILLRYSKLIWLWVRVVGHFCIQTSYESLTKDDYLTYGLFTALYCCSEAPRVINLRIW